MRPEITILPAVCGPSPNSCTLNTLRRLVLLGKGLGATVVNLADGLVRQGKGRSGTRVVIADLGDWKTGKNLKRPEMVSRAIPM